MVLKMGNHRQFTVVEHRVADLANFKPNGKAALRGRLMPPKPTARVAQGGSDRIYERLARQLIGELTSGRFEVGDRLPAERELATEYEVSRPAVREAMIALEVQGLIEVRIGSGAYVKRLPGNSEEQPGFHATAFEVTEARVLFEGEAAALAAAQITEDEMKELEGLVAQMRRPDLRVGEIEAADRAFTF